MNQQPGGGGQFGGPGSNQPNYYMPAPSPYQQQGTPLSSFVHSPGSALDPSPGGGVYSSLHQLQQSQQLQPSQQIYQYMASSPAQQQSELLSRQLGFGSAPPSVGSPMAASGPGNIRSHPASLTHMLPPTPQPPTPRGPQTPVSVGGIGSVGGGDYGGAGVGGPGSVNPATPRSVGDPSSISDQHHQQMMAANKNAAIGSNSSFTATLLDQDSNSQMDSPQQQQQSQVSNSAIQQQQNMTGSGRGGMTISTSASSQNLNESANSNSASRVQNASGGNVVGTSAAAQALQNLDQYGPLALCSLGKELTQELVNRTADMFLLLRALTDPNQQFPKTAVPELTQQLNDKERRLNESLRHTAALAHRLLAMCVRLEQLSKDRLPADAEDRVKELLPYVINEKDTKSEMDTGESKLSFLEEVRRQTDQREEYQSTRLEHEQVKQELIKKREHLKNIMEFLREFCWQISMVLDSNATSP